MEPKYYAFRRWSDTPIIIWQYDWMPRDPKESSMKPSDHLGDLPGIWHHSWWLSFKQSEKYAQVKLDHHLPRDRGELLKNRRDHISLVFLCCTYYPVVEWQKHQNKTHWMPIKTKLSEISAMFRSHENDIRSILGIPVCGVPSKPSFRLPHRYPRENCIPFIPFLLAKNRDYHKGLSYNTSSIWVFPKIMVPQNGWWK